MTRPTDRQLIIGMQRGERGAMEEFFRRFSPYLYAVCLRYLPDRELAKDILHDTFIKIFTSISTFRIDQRQDEMELTRSVKSWAARVTANLALNHLRDHSHWQAVPIDDATVDDIPDEEIDTDILSTETLMRLIEDLPPNYRTVFNLYAIDGFSHREISAMLGISESLSATQYHRAKSLLKQRIKQYLNTH